MNRRDIIKADIRNLERQCSRVASAEERVMLELMLGDRRADLAVSAGHPMTTFRTSKRER